MSTDGASSLTRTVAGNVAQGLQLGTDLTGIDLNQLLARLVGARGEVEPNGTKKAVLAAPKQVSTDAGTTD